MQKKEEQVNSRVESKIKLIYSYSHKADLESRRAGERERESAGTDKYKVIEEDNEKIKITIIDIEICHMKGHNQHAIT